MRKIIIIFLLINYNFMVSQNNLEIDSNSFIPESGKYIVSGWVKEVHSQQKITFSSSIIVEISGVTSPVFMEIYPTGAIIDGWQRLIGIVKIPEIIEETSSLGEVFLPKLEISLNCNNSSGNECYFDDIRFYPYNGNMKSFVYDEDTQRLMAELDENNYATFYEYDLEGGLVRVKKETERGVFTIQETRSNNPKKDE